MLPQSQKEMQHLVDSKNVCLVFYIHLVYDIYIYIYDNYFRREILFSLPKYKSFDEK